MRRTDPTCSLKGTGSLAMTANTFGLAVSTVSKHIFEVCHVIAKNLGPKYMFLPRNKEEIREKAADLKQSLGYPKLLDALMELII